MSGTHFSVPSTTGPASNNFELAAIQGAAAALIVAIEKGYLPPSNQDNISAFIKLVKAGLLKTE